MPTSVPASEPRNALGGGTVNIASELSWRESEREDVMQSFALFFGGGIYHGVLYKNGKRTGYKI